MIPCRECGEPTEYTQEIINQPLFGGNPKVAVCDDCCEKDRLRQQEYNAEFTKFVQQPVEDLIRPLYMETTLSNLPTVAQINWQDLQHWSPTMNMGVRLCGNSRTGKTRLMCLLLHKLHVNGEVFKIFYAGEFHSELNAAKRGGHYMAWRDEVINVPILAIDDLFAEKMTPTIESGLFEVINQRMERKLPLIYTSQVTEKEAVNMFSDQRRGQAFYNRLRETCKLYHFKGQRQEEMLGV